MKMKDYKKNLNPSLALTFLISMVTGLMLFFHIGSSGIKHLHEWMSIIFVILCIIHLTLNWELLCTYVKKGPAKISFIVILILSMILLFGGGNDRKHINGRTGARHAVYSDSAYKNF